MTRKILLIIRILILLTLGVILLKIILLRPKQYREQLHTQKVVQLLLDTATAQRKFATQNKHFAKNWEELDKKPFRAKGPTYCTKGPQPQEPIEGFTGCGGAQGYAVTLARKGVVAYRVNTPMQYVLVREYHQPGILCEAINEGGESFCQNFWEI